MHPVVSSMAFALRSPSPPPSTTSITNLLTLYSRSSTSTIPATSSDAALSVGLIVAIILSFLVFVVAGVLIALYGYKRHRSPCPSSSPARDSTAFLTTQDSIELAEMGSWRRRGSWHKQPEKVYEFAGARSGHTAKHVLPG